MKLTFVGACSGEVNGTGRWSREIARCGPSATPVKRTLCKRCASGPGRTKVSEHRWSSENKCVDVA